MIIAHQNFGYYAAENLHNIFKCNCDAIVRRTIPTIMQLDTENTQKALGIKLAYKDISALYL